MTNVEKKQQQNSAKTPKNSPTHTRAVYKQLVNMCACVCVYVYLCRLGHLKVKRINSAAPERGFQSKVQQPAARGDKERWEGGKKPAKIVAFSGEFANCTSCSGHAAFKERASERVREGHRLRVRVSVWVHAKMLTLASWGISNILFMLINQYITLLSELFYSLFIGIY